MSVASKKRRRWARSERGRAADAIERLDPGPGPAFYDELVNISGGSQAAIEAQLGHALRSFVGKPNPAALKKQIEAAVRRTLPVGMLGRLEVDVEPSSDGRTMNVKVREKP